MSSGYKVLMVHGHYQIRGGEDSSFDAETSLLREAGHEVKTFVRDNFDVEKQGKLKTAINTVWSRESQRQIGEILEKEKFDVMHVQNFFPLLSPSVYGPAKRAGVGVVQTLRNYRLMCANALLAREGQPCELCLGKWFGWSGVRHKCYRGSALGSAVLGGMNLFHRVRNTWDKDVDRFIVASEVARRKYCEAGFPESRIRVKPNVVQSVAPTNGGEGDNAANREGAIYVGRMSEEKGVETLVKAWMEGGVSQRLTLAGDGPLLSKLQEISRGCSNIHWCGRVATEEAYRLMSQAEVLLLPTECYETFGRTVVEAYATATPVIASRNTAPGDLVQDGVTGFHCEAGNAGDLAQTVRAFFEKDESEREKLRSSALQVYGEKFSRAENLKIMESIYGEAITRRKEQRSA